MGNSRVVLKILSCRPISGVETGTDWKNGGGGVLWELLRRMGTKESLFPDLEGPPLLAWGIWLA